MPPDTTSTGVSAMRHSWLGTEPLSRANPQGALGKAATAPATFYLQDCSWGGATHPTQHHQLTWVKPAPVPSRTRLCFKPQQPAR